MADPVLELDAAGSNIDGTNPGTAMLLVDATTGWGLTAFDAPQPELKLLWTSSIDTDGSRRADPGSYENRTVTASLDCERSTAALLQAQLNTLGKKIGKIAREGGTLKVTYPSGNSFIFDLLAGSHNIQFDHAFVLGNLAQVTVSFTALPGARGAEQDLGDNVETTLPALVFTEASIPGDLDALGRLVVDNDSSSSWRGLVLGAEDDAEYTHTTSSGSAGLFYEAESRTVLGATTAIPGTGGASGSGGNKTVLLASLAPVWQPMLSTQATGGGAHLSHVGTFRVYARVFMTTGNTGSVSIRFDWTAGDFQNVTSNPAVTFEADHLYEGNWLLVDLGLVSIPKVSQGTQRWEGRISAKSTVAGDDLEMDYLLLAPVKAAYGVARSSVDVRTPGTFIARDEFDQSAGALAAKTLPVGGTWTGAGDADDFAVETTGKTAQRSVSGDAAFDVGRFARAGTSTPTDTLVSVDFKTSSTATMHRQGVFARYADTSNYVMLAFDPFLASVFVTKEVAGAGGTLLGQTSVGEDVADVPNVWFTAQLIVTATGEWFVFFGRQGSTLTLIRSGQHGDLATGGSLASGGVGMVDASIASTATRNYDNFYATTPAVDAVVYAGQSLEIRHDRIGREDSAGVTWGRVHDYQGSYLRLSPSGAENRGARVMLKPWRSDPETMFDHYVFDDISARLFVTPIFLNVPSA